MLLTYSLSFVNWPVSSVDVDKTGDNISSELLTEVINPTLAQGWFRLNINDVKKTVEDLSWVKSVKVSRVFPDKLTIKVAEHNAIARWGSTHLISDNGITFIVSNQEKFFDLPLLEMSKENIPKVFAAVLKINHAMKKLHFSRLTTVKFSDKYGWEIVFDNKLLVMFMANDFVVNLDSFIRNYPLILASRKGVAPRLIDMRYYNGAAVI